MYYYCVTIYRSLLFTFNQKLMILMWKRKSLINILLSNILEPAAEKLLSTAAEKDWKMHWNNYTLAFMIWWKFVEDMVVEPCQKSPHGEEKPHLLNLIIQVTFLLGCRTWWQIAVAQNKLFALNFIVTFGDPWIIIINQYSLFNELTYNYY